MKTSDIVIRDPFIFPCREENTYYMFGSTEKRMGCPEKGFCCFKSHDLVEWEGPFESFIPDENFWADRNFWAPEVHEYRGRYYMFGSFKRDGSCRGTQILAADSPGGRFQPLSDSPATPRDWECLDGTFFVEDGKPYMIFCHEWVQIGDGTIELLPLTDDLSAPAGETQTLFHASEAPWVRQLNVTWKTDHKENFVTDGPFLFQMNGKLFMLWSSFGEEGYAMGIAESVSGKIRGPWKHFEQPVFAKDGGHGMIFKTFDGKYLCSLHQPNHPDEHPVFFPFVLPQA